MGGRGERAGVRRALLAAGGGQAGRGRARRGLGQKLSPGGQGFEFCQAVGAARIVGVDGDHEDVGVLLLGVLRGRAFVVAHAKVTSSWVHAFWVSRAVLCMTALGCIQRDRPAGVAS